MTIYAAITGWGLAVPDSLVTNADLERRIDTSDEWIRTRTGILQRYVAAPHEATSTFAIAAGCQALERAGVAADKVDLVVLATCTPDRPFPATACTVQAALGLHHAGAFDLGAACSGFVYGLHVATGLVRSGLHRTVLLVAADIFTRYINWNDRNTAVLFGDGAGAVVLQATTQPLGLLASNIGAWGEGEDLMAVDAGGSRLPLSPELLAQGRQYVYMNGREIFRHAVRGMAESSLRAIADAGLQPNQVDCIIPHQANLRIIEALAKRLNMPRAQIVVNLDHYGNTSAASVPIALAEAVAAGQLCAGQYALLTAFGGGLTWASGIIRWGQVIE